MFGFYILGGLAVIIGAVFTYLFWLKSQIVYSGQIQCSSGDSEVMSFNFNFQKGETEDSKDSKLSGIWQMIQDRRDENHEKWLAMKEAAIKENEQKESQGEELKLRSVTE